MMVSVILGGTLELDLSLHRPPRLPPTDQRRTSSTTQFEEREVRDKYVHMCVWRGGPLETSARGGATPDAPQYRMGPAHASSNSPWALSQAEELELALALATMEAEAEKAGEAEEVDGEEAERPLQWKRAPQTTAEAAALAGALAASAEDLALCGPPSSPSGAASPTSALEEEAQLQLALARSEAEAAAPPPPPPTATPTYFLTTPTPTPAAMPATAPFAAVVTAVIAPSAVKEAFTAHRMRRRSTAPAMFTPSAIKEAFTAHRMMRRRSLSRVRIHM